jgi:hypothetical protein
MTVPLIEPRYFIVPWLVWRINNPMEPQQEDNYEAIEGSKEALWHHGLSLLSSYRLWIEMA